jgi:indole-3-glycerol phosphate synthase
MALGSIALNLQVFMPTDLLQKICADKRDHIASRKSQTPLAQLEAVIADLPPPRDFTGALQQKLALGEFGLIAEMKRASPSAGPLRDDYHPSLIAAAYRTGGAACLSVLTDTPYFEGCDEDLSLAATGNLPILRKDFMLDVYQIVETRALGADCILLIMAALDDAAAHELHAAACHYGLHILIETHNAAEMERALKLPSGMIGINNRNLKTLVTDLGTTAELAHMVPADRLLVSESGLRHHQDLLAMAAHGARCFLVGEHVLKQADLAQATQNLLRGS